MVASLLSCVTLHAALFTALGCSRAISVSIQAPAPTEKALPLPQVNGTYYQVQRGESLWGIAHDFGWDIESLARVNRLANPKQLKVGQRIFIPPPPASHRFLWPARGTVTTSTEGGADGSTRGLDIRAPEGTLVRASRSGRVAVATQQLAGWGQAVLLDHGDGYVTVYARLEQLLVSPGATVQQGNPVGQLGRSPLYFEIRYGTSVRDPHQLLP